MQKQIEAMKLARDWIGDPHTRTVSAGKMVAILTEALAEQPAQQEPICAELLDACKRARLAMAAAAQGDANFLGEYQRLDAVIAKAEVSRK